MSLVLGNATTDLINATLDLKKENLFSDDLAPKKTAIFEIYSILEHFDCLMAQGDRRA